MSHAPDRPAGAVPPRTDWTELPGHTPAGALLTELVIATFRLNGRLQEIAQRLAAHGGLTAAWWQVLGGVLDQPRTVADVARAMGMSRQGVQRVADLLVTTGSPSTAQTRRTAAQSSCPAPTRAWRPSVRSRPPSTHGPTGPARGSAPRTWASRSRPCTG
ncbi:MAG: MarR family transcriptional regulator [Solirubrobacteraceae bacterium]